ncbi:hypothetical protein PEC18_10825 [Paucibacter sp. O1-1]|nr:hypothetical protein [Paucibacter sp. O1-1]MDA3826321.1 hypothetical protein [Paucibacter sp. O1-1]
MTNTIGATPPAASAAPLSSNARTPAVEAAQPAAGQASAGDVICAFSPAGLAALSEVAQQGLEQGIDQVVQLAQDSGDQLLQGLGALSEGAQSLVEGAAPYATLGALVLGQLMSERA